MSFNVQEGEPLVLRLLLPEQDDSKFVRAIVKDEDGLELTGSPFDLVNSGDGEYFFKDEMNLVFPENKLEVVAIYQIYDDAAYTIPTVDYGQQAVDLFRNLDVQVTVGDIELGDSFEQALERVEKLVNETLKLRDDINVLVEDDEAVEVELSYSDEAVEIGVEEEDEILVELSNSDEPIEMEIEDDEDIEILITEED